MANGFKARGTTLGADNGIGMASALAVLADDNVVHGPLEVLLTMTEEAGMDGAFRPPVRLVAGRHPDQHRL
ncbi:aminoacyl-histidine dipeptidase [Salmonella enterica subsp. enterica]|uniref:Aminoacyl-histidine dipeptidase n=1 Tax=Salmonella enterica I TaxID=59201 RepID=A0A3S4M1F4_SALET|nr:aminoacyl-histidine dipeptidase [Salmonella enterica subsp. enterica]